MECLLLGAGGHAREIADIEFAARANGVGLGLSAVAADWCDDPKRFCTDFNLPFLGSFADVLAARPPGRFVVAVGAGAARERITALMVGRGWQEADPLVHPSAVIGRSAQLDRGVVVFPAARVSTNVRLGRQVHINAGAIVGHDVVCGAFASVNPGAVVSGGATLGERSMVGANATILERRSIANDVVVGAGAVVTRDVTVAAATVVGVPARAIG